MTESPHRSDRPTEPNLLEGREVLVVTDHAPIGGGSTVAAALLEEWTAAGVIGCGVALGNIPPEARDRLPEGTWKALEGRGHLGRVRLLRRHLLTTSSRSRLLFAIGEYPALIAVVARALAPRLRGMPIVLGEHQPRSIATVLSNRHRPLGHLVSLVVKWLRRRTAAAVCLSEHQRDDLRRDGLVPRGPMVVIANPCVLPEAPRTVVAERVARLAAGEHIRLLTVGSINPAKGQDLLLKVMSRLDERHVLSIVGGGESTELAELASDLGIAERVEFLGVRLDVATLMDAHDLFVLPSRYESFGLVVIEAIVRGMPVAATACNASIPALATRVGSLRVAPVDDESALGAAILDLESQAWDVDRLMATARACSADHDPVRAARAHLELFAKIAGDGVSVSRGG